MKRLSALLLPVLLLSCDPFSTTNGTVDEANERYEAGEHEEAATRYEQARDEIPERAELHYDVGTNLLAQGKAEEAEVAFSRALETAGEEIRPMVLANLGLARFKKALAIEDEAARKEALAAALDALEKAVALRPDLDSARRNLELVLLHLFPPCERREDPFEPNDRPDDAKSLEELADAPLLLCPGNVDLFRTDLKAGDRFTATLTQTGEAEAAPPKLELLDRSGAIVAEGNADGKSVVARLEAPREGTYFLKIREEDEEEHPYTLTTEVLASCKSLEDGAEENDSQDAAAELPVRPQAAGPDGQAAPPTTQLRVCPADPDWFRFDLRQHESVLLQVQYEPVEGDLAARLVDAQGRELARSTGSRQGKEGEEGGDKGSLVISLLDVRSDQPLFLELTGATPEAEASATVTAIVRPPCPAGDDQLEENDGIDQPTPLNPPAEAAPAAPAQGQGEPQAQPQQPIQHLLRRCPGDDDWFLVEVKKEEPQQLQITFDHDRGDLRMELYEEGGSEPVQTSDQSTARQPGEGFVLGTEEESERFLVRVTADDETTNFYQLTLQPPKPRQGDNPNQDDEKKDDEKKDDEKKDDQSKDQQQPDEKQPEKQSPQEKSEQQSPQETPMEQMMEQLDQEKRPNLEAEKALRKMPNVQAPGGKVW
jgi:tetratricopeptide (TPR) repeat protein